MKKLIFLAMVFAALAGNTSDLYARCTAGNCVNGTGTFLYPSGSRYEGEFKNGSFHGSGTYYFFNGSQYKGNWKEGEMSGRGTWRYANGMKMKADFSEGKVSGNPEPEPMILYKDFNYISSIVPENTDMLMVMKSVEDIFTQLPITEDSFFGEKIKNTNRMKNELGFNPFSKKDLEELGVDMNRQVGVVVSDVELKDANGPSLNVVISLPVKKDEKILSLMKSTIKRISRNRARFEYEGDVLRFSPGGTTKDFKKTFGVVKRNGYLFLGFNPNGNVVPYLQKILDRKKSLADSAIYREVAGKIDTGEELFVYLDGRRFGELYSMLMMQSAKSGGRRNQQMMGMFGGMIKNVISMMKDYRGFGVTLDYNRGDLLLRGVTVLREGSEMLKMYKGITYDRENVLGISKKPVGLAVVGINMKEYIAFMMKSLPSFLAMSVEGKMKKWKDEDGIDVQTELIDNLGGNINAGLYDGGTFSSENLNIVITANVKDVKVMNTFLEKVFADAPKDKVKPHRIGGVRGRILILKKTKIFLGMSGKNLVMALSKSLFRDAMKPRMSRTFLYRVDPEIAKVVNKDGSVIYVDSAELVKAVKSFSRAAAKKQKGKGKTKAKKDDTFERIMKRFHYAYLNSWSRENEFFTKLMLKTKFDKPFFWGVADLIQEMKALEKKKREKAAAIREKK